MKKVYLLFAVAAALCLSFGSVAFAQEGPHTFQTNLESLNGSGASGTATVEVNGDQVTVTTNSSGLTPGQPHAQHIHIGGDNVCPPPSADTDGSGAISTAEGQPFYGAIEVSLTTRGDVSTESGTAVDRMPVADENGNLSYSRTFTLPDDVSPSDIENGVIVQHGIDFNGNGEYDASAGQSSVDPSLPFEGTVPANCGEFAAATGGMTALPDTGGVSLLGPAAVGGAALALLGVGGLFVARRRV